MAPTAGFFPDSGHPFLPAVTGLGITVFGLLALRRLAARHETAGRT
jgi:hypothetical protein